MCNRLLCCLTYEYENYREMKKGMPRAGRSILLEGKTYHVTRQLPLIGRVAAVGSDGEEHLLTEEEWRAAEPVARPPGRKGPGRKGSGPGRRSAGDDPEDSEPSGED